MKIFVKLISRQEFLSILFVNRISKIRFQDLKKKEFNIIIERFFFLSILIIMVVARFVDKNKFIVFVFLVCVIFFLIVIVFFKSRIKIFVFVYFIVICTL